MPLILATLLLATPPTSQPAVDLAAHFRGYTGCFVLLDVRSGEVQRYNAERCAKRLPPCSTFKIFNALAGLETGAVAGADTLFRWDGSKQHFKSWERDHTLASAMQNSVVWYFQKVARAIGRERMQEFLDRTDYGTRQIGKEVDMFWLNGDLTISADEQIEFLRKLYADELPFKPEHQATVRKLIELRRGAGWVFSGKTGSNADKRGYTLGWFVGHVQNGSREYIFAGNIADGPEPSGMTAKRICWEIMRDMRLVSESTE